VCVCVCVCVCVWSVCVCLECAGCSWQLHITSCNVATLTIDSRQADRLHA